MQDYSGYGQPPAGPTMPMPPMPPPPPRRRVGMLSYLLVALAAGALGAGTVVALYNPSSSSTPASAQPSFSPPAAQPSGAVPQPSSGGSGASASEQAIINKVEPGLVIINTELQYQSDAAAATGMVINSDGLVLTNNHVIEDSTSITATTATGKKYTAKVLGYDTTGDIALIQLQNASGLKTVPLGNSGSVKVGDQVVAMGNAEGQSAIVPAAGQVTALNQTVTASDAGGSISTETLHDMIGDNADIVQGDSGGPLADSAGEVIGMDTAGNGGGGFGVQQQQTNGYAIPINNALAVARQIDAGQASSTITIGYPPFMGVYIGQGSNANPQAQAQQAEQPGYGSGNFGNGYGNYGGGTQSCYTSNRNLQPPTDIANVSSGTLILGTICSSPAQAAGMTAGSVITAVNGQAVSSPDSLTGVVSKYHPGDTISVTWVNPSGKRSTASLKLTAGPPL